MTDDETRQQVAALRKALRERNSGAHQYDVRMRVSGYIVYRVHADSPEQAEDRAWQRFESGEDPHDNDLDCYERVTVTELPGPTPLLDLLKEPRDE